MVEGIVKSLIGAGIAVGGAAKGMKDSAKYNNEAQSMVDDLKQSNDAWYDMRINSDPSQRSEWQAGKKMMMDAFSERFSNADKSKIVTGGTDASITQEQIAATNALADSATSLMGQESTRQDNLAQAQLETNNSLTQQQVQMKQQQANNSAQAAGQAISAGLGMMSSGLGGIKKTK